MYGCEHFIYTTANTNSKTGYQIIASSKGITDNMIKKLEHYLLPTGLSPDEFKHSRSLIMLDKENIAYSNIKNIGKGYDGRDGTLYNHTIIIKQTDFNNLQNDSRILDQYYYEDYHVRRELQPLNILNKPIPINFAHFDIPKDRLIDLICLLFKHEKIAVLDNMDLNFIQNLILLIPPSLRLIPFSTLVVNPHKQPKYKLIQPSANINPSQLLNFNTVHIRDKEGKSKFRSKFEYNIQPMIDIIMSGDENNLKKIHEKYENIFMHPARSIFKFDDIEKIGLERAFESKNYDQITKKIQEIYSHKKLKNVSFPSIIQLTSQIRKMIQKHIQNQMLSHEHCMHILPLSPSLTIILNYMNYIKFHDQKINHKNMKKLELEIEILEKILTNQQYIIATKYKFDIYRHYKSIFKPFSHDYLFDLWKLRKKWKNFFWGL